MSRLKRLSILLFAAAALVPAALPAAYAADLIEPVPLPEPLPATSGWYLRGDVGYVLKSHKEGDWDFWNQNPLALGIDDTYRFDKLEIGKTASFGGGVGYRYNDFLRGDATLDYFRTDVNSRTECPYMIKLDAQHQLPQGASCGYDGSGKADVWAAMANAYVDLPIFGALPIVPYVGAGLGAALVDYDDLDALEKCPTCSAPGWKAYRWKQQGIGDWRFAQALMAGATVDLTGHLKLDAGYKYTHVQGGDAFHYDAADKATGASGTQTRDHGYDLHAVRVGLRYEFY